MDRLSSATHCFDRTGMNIYTAGVFTLGFVIGVLLTMLVLA